MTILKSIATCLALFAAPALADVDERFTVHTYKDWIVQYVTYTDSTPQCVAAFDGRVSAFMIMSEGRGVQFKFFDGQGGGERGWYEVILQIDRNRWRVDGEFDGSALFVDVWDENLLMAVANGSRLTLRNEDGKPIYR